MVIMSSSDHKCQGPVTAGHLSSCSKRVGLLRYSRTDYSTVQQCRKGILTGISLAVSTAKSAGWLHGVSSHNLVKISAQAT
jgi:hypothetical protein